MAKAPNSLEKVATSLPSLSYIAIMKALVAAKYKVPEPMQKSAAFITMTIIEAKSTQITNEANAASLLNSTLATIDGNIKSLGSNPKNLSAVQLQQIYNTQFQSIRAETIERTDQHKKLNEIIKEYSGDKNKLFSEIVKDFVEKKPAAQLNAKLAEIEKPLKPLSDQTTKVQINENALQKRLDSLSTQTTRAREAISLGAPVAPSQVDQLKK